MLPLSLLLSSKARAEVFRLLFGTGDRELHSREIARRAGLNDATVRQELRNLVQLGLVEGRRSGNRLYYRACEEHPLYPEIHNLVLKTSGLSSVLREALESAPIQAAFVFGSVAAGEEAARSDIDLMVIGSISLRELSKCLAGVAERLGREINSHVLEPGEFIRRRRARDHFVTSIMRGPKLFVIGNERDLRELGE